VPPGLKIAIWGLTLGSFVCDAQGTTDISNCMALIYRTAPALKYHRNEAVDKSLADQTSALNKLKKMEPLPYDGNDTTKMLLDHFRSVIKPECIYSIVLPESLGPAVALLGGSQTMITHHPPNAFMDSSVGWISAAEVFVVYKSSCASRQQYTIPKSHNIAAMKCSLNNFITFETPRYNFNHRECV